MRYPHASGQNDAAKLLELPETRSQKFGSGFLETVARNIGIILTAQLSNLCGHPLKGLLWHKTNGKSLVARNTTLLVSIRRRHNKRLDDKPSLTPMW